MAMSNFLSFQSPLLVWQAHPTFLVVEAIVILSGILGLVHAFKTSKAAVSWWLGSFFHGVVVELVSYAMPDIDNFLACTGQYHAILGKAATGASCWVGFLMLIIVVSQCSCFQYIALLYPTFYYFAGMAASRLPLSVGGKAVAVGLLVVLIDLPYDFNGAKFVWW